MNETQLKERERERSAYIFLFFLEFEFVPKIQTCIRRRNNGTTKKTKFCEQTGRKLRVKYAQHGCPWDNKTCSSAVIGTSVFEIRARNGCPWDEKTCFWAAKWSPRVFEIRARKRMSWHEWTCPNAPQMVTSIV